VLASGCNGETSSGGPGGAPIGTSSSGSTTGAGDVTSASSTSTGVGGTGGATSASTSSGVGGGTGGATSAASSSSSGSGGCGAGQTQCLSGCATLATDPTNCGACEHACYGGASCVAGVCGQIACAGTLGFPGAPMIDVPMRITQFPGVMAEGDVNGDGKLDLIVATQSPGSLAVVLNQGNGTFAPPISASKMWSPVAVAARDLDGNGKLDLVVLDYFGVLAIWLGQGDGTFLAGATYPTGASGTSLAVGDLNGDGKPDFAVTNAQHTFVQLNNGNGTFAAPVNYDAAVYIPGVGYGPTGGLFPQTVTFGDVNGDGKLDLIVGNQGYYADAVQGQVRDPVSIFLNQGAGAFALAGEYDAGAAPAHFATGDFNGDGKLDIAVVDTLVPSVPGSQVSVLLNQGNGGFGAAVGYTMSDFPSAISAADVDGDGKLDLAVSAVGHDKVGGEISTLKNLGNGTFAPAVHFGAGEMPGSLATGDLNGDGQPDLAAANPTSGTLSVLLNQGNGVFPSPVTYGPTVGTLDVVVADLDGDGRLDFATANPYTSDVNVQLNQGSGVFVNPVSVALVASANKLAVGDLNGDGRLDMVALAKGASLLFNQGNGTFTAGVSLSVGQFPAAIALADVSGDGKVDIIVGDGIVNEVSVLLNLGNALFAAPVKYSVSTTASSIEVGDLNGDGTLDLAIGAGGGNPPKNMSILLNSGGGVFGAAIINPTSYPPVSIALGDVNGDGKLDIAFAGFDVNPVLAGHAGVLLNQGNGLFVASPTTYPLADGSRTIKLADLNGDGKPDLVVGTVHGTVSVMPGQGNATFGAPADFAGRSYAIATGDLDGDGALDLVTGNGDVVVMLNRCLP
jgi:hypothetical protein